MQLTQNQDVGTMKRDPYSNEEMKTQLQPQQVRMKMKPGENLSFTLRYLHQDRQTRDVYVLNSETSSQGVYIVYQSECRGKITPGNICKSIAPAEVVSFNVTVSLKECKTSGDAVVSVGVGGLRDVVALYITPVCGCECEKLENQEMSSPHCSSRGKLVCGSCVCDQRYTGDICECEIPPELKSADDLVNLCRGRPMDKVCSGRGKCKCGVCECNAPHINSGKYCECDDTSCPMYNSILCGGHGECKCGICQCEGKWIGSACECSTNASNCLSSNGMICNNHGSCECNQCVCSSGYFGVTCEECPTCAEPQTTDTEEDVEPYTESGTDLSSQEQDDILTDPSSDVPSSSETEPSTASPALESSSWTVHCACPAILIISLVLQKFPELLLLSPSLI